VERTVVLYDLTNTYFEGQALRNKKARRGNSKEKRHDRPLVVLGMLYDGSGFALAHKTFAGNTNDGSSLVEMVGELKACNKPDAEEGGGGQQMELDEQSARPETRTLVVVDAGISTRENLVMLGEAGFSYLVNDTRSKRGRYREEFCDHAEFRILTERADADKKPPVEVRMLREPAAGTGDQSARKTDTILLCRSQGRRQKEEAMFSKAEERFLEAAEKLDFRLREGRLAKQKKVHQAIGRLKAKNPRVQRYYTIELREESNPGAGLLFECKERELRKHRELFGCYVLRTDREDFAPEELWSVYIGLTQAEEGFRALKTDLGLRPNFHQKEDRVDGHIFITVMAFHLWKWIRQKLDCAKDTRDWATVRNLLSTHCYATLIVPCEDGSVYHLRKPGRPEFQQGQLYKLFGVKISNLLKTTVKFRETDTN
jgi:transposase